MACSETFVVASVAPATVPPVPFGCDNDDECPTHTACRNRLCINPCAYDDPCSPSANCQVLNHKPVCTCPDGYIGDPKTSCRLRKLLEAKASWPLDMLIMKLLFQPRDLTVTV